MTTAASEQQDWPLTRTICHTTGLACNKRNTQEVPSGKMSEQVQLCDMRDFPFISIHLLDISRFKCHQHFVRFNSIESYAEDRLFFFQKECWWMMIVELQGPSIAETRSSETV